MQNDSFVQRLEGRFDGMISQENAQCLAVTMAQRDGWYLLGPQGEPPEHPVEGVVARQHLDLLLQEILREEQGGWSTLTSSPA